MKQWNFKMKKLYSVKDSGSIRQKTFVTINILVVKAGVVAGGGGWGGLIIGDKNLFYR